MGRVARHVLFWVGEGVRTFRVDNPHTKPLPFWEWLIREVKARCPEAIFLSEAFTRPKVMRALAKAGFSQSYTYFTWRNTKDELMEYLTELTQVPGHRVFSAQFLHQYARISCRSFCRRGAGRRFASAWCWRQHCPPAYGIYNGFELCENTAIPGREEYLNSEKYEYKVWDWDRPGNIKDDIRILNRFRRDNPALHEFQNLRFLHCPNPEILAYVKVSGDRANAVIIVVNLDPRASAQADVELPLAELGLTADRRFSLEEAFTSTRRDLPRRPSATSASIPRPIRQ